MITVRFGAVALAAFLTLSPVTAAYAQNGGGNNGGQGNCQNNVCGAPGPEVGAGLPSLVTFAGGAAALWRRRRKKKCS